MLLSAGIGSRLQPITRNIPKCLVPIHGRPLLDYWLAILFANSIIERALINTHHLPTLVEAHVARSCWCDRIDLIHEPELLGTGGTLKANRAYFGGDSFLVAHADNLTDLDLTSFAAAHAARPAHCAITMLTFRSDNPHSCGIIELDDDDVVQAFYEKVEQPPGNLANGAVYLFTPEVADFTARLPGNFVDLSTQIIPAFIGRIYAVSNNGYHRDIGDLESLNRARTEFPIPARR